ncbi:MAG: patatin-like phospholipase family protein [Kofleriaceae bacterium]|jgi:NTE family protein|nr:patatin-like phospholipase family protein [Kofleriaceae bacterium]MBP9169600.1 patatin-like phospholipase family protein [Kofleriaceae bacterium]MBP9858589.1 patatin-like phospholipase family protein [Kofleriaceae bacterium]
MSSAPERPSAIVLAGASALGAYQAGVLRYLVHEVARDLPRGFGFDILSGTSAGSINALALASAADDPVAAVDAVCAAWTSLELRAVLRPSAIEVLAMTADLAGVPGRLKRALRAHGVRGGLLDARPFARILESVATPGAIADHLAHGHLRALAMSTTHVATGRAVVFHQSHAAVRSGGDASAMTPAVLTVQHALASAAIPLLFPAVALAGDLYCDGGLRQMVPLSPAINLGARRVLMVNPGGGERPGPAEAAARRAAASSPLYLAGKALNAMFVDGLDGDLDRLTKVNQLLAAGVRRYGPGFVDAIGDELAAVGAPRLAPIDVVHLEPSHDVGAMAAAHVSAAGFAHGRGAAGLVLRWLADGEPYRAGDLLSYLLFDGAFAGALIELGQADARARHRDLVALFA